MDTFPIVIPAFPAAPIVQNPFGKRKIDLLLTPRRHTVTHPPFVDPEPAVSTPETGKAVQCKIKNLVSLFQPLLLTKRRIISINDPALVLIQKLPGKLPCFGFIRSFQPGDVYKRQVLANTFDKKDMYEELVYLNSLSYNCYSIMRANINIGEHYGLTMGVPLQKERVLLNKFCLALADNIQRLLSSSSIEFRCSITEEPVYTQIDASRLTVAILNAIHNSCVFSDLNNIITFSLRKQGESFVITTVSYTHLLRRLTAFRPKYRSNSSSGEMI